MPIVDGRYEAPTWVNGQAPAIDAAELQAICDTLANAILASEVVGLANGGTNASTAAAALFNLINGSSALGGANLANEDYIGVDDVSAGVGKKVALSDLITFLSAKGVTNVQTGSYTGTGTYSVSINFPKTPKAVFITPTSGVNGQGGYIWLYGSYIGKATDNLGGLYYGLLTWNGTALSWDGKYRNPNTAEVSSATVLNTNGTTYGWLALC